MKCYSAIGRMNEATCSNMDGPRHDRTSEVNQTEKDKFHVISLYVES